MKSSYVFVWKKRWSYFKKKTQKQPRFGQLWCFCRQWKPAIKLTPYAGRLTKMEKITDMNQWNNTDHAILKQKKDLFAPTYGLRKLPSPTHFCVHDFIDMIPALIPTIPPVLTLLICHSFLILFVLFYFRTSSDQSPVAYKFFLSQTLTTSNLTSHTVPRSLPRKAFSLRILAGKKHPKIKLQRSQKIRTWTFGWLVHQINSISEVLKLEQISKRIK